jgi:hypothetical protein
MLRLTLLQRMTNSLLFRRGRGTGAVVVGIRSRRFGAELNCSMIWLALEGIDVGVGVA